MYVSDTERAEIRAFLPSWRPESAEPFPAYTVPAFELRRLLDEAREMNESFTLECEPRPPHGRAGKHHRQRALR